MWLEAESGVPWVFFMTCRGNMVAFAWGWVGVAKSVTRLLNMFGREELVERDWFASGCEENSCRVPGMARGLGF